MPRDLIDDFVDALKDAATIFVRERFRITPPREPRTRRKNIKPPKVKTPKTPKAAKREARGPTLYDVLEVSPKASRETIEAAYKSLARRFHPDTNRTKQAEERMKILNNAKDILLDPVKRRAYDRGYAL